MLGGSSNRRGLYRSEIGQTPVLLARYLFSL